MNTDFYWLFVSFFMIWFKKRLEKLSRAYRWFGLCEVWLIFYWSTTPMSPTKTHLIVIDIVQWISKTILFIQLNLTRKHKIDFDRECMRPIISYQKASFIHLFFPFVLFFRTKLFLYRHRNNIYCMYLYYYSNRQCSVFITVSLKRIFFNKTSSYRHTCQSLHFLDDTSNKYWFIVNNRKEVKKRKKFFFCCVL